MSRGSMAPFVLGRDLARAFYHEVLRGIVGASPHAVALLGEGSDVLGFDTVRSTDHAWGPRAQIFVEAADVADLRQRLERDLPTDFRGWPVRFYRWQTGRVEHHVEVTTVGEWLQANLGRDPRPAMPLNAWLSTPRQLLLEVTGGLVFRDDTGELTRVRALLAWYPQDVWLWIMAAHWSRLATLETFIGRTAELGDDLGARLVLAASVIPAQRRTAILSSSKVTCYQRTACMSERGDDGWQPGCPCMIVDNYAAA